MTVAIKPHVLAHARLCGSLDIYLVGDAWGWYVVEGVELSDALVLELLDRTFFAGHMTAGISWFSHEDDANAAFARRVEGG